MATKNPGDDLVHLIASQATAQFVKGLLLGMVLTVAIALAAARMLLFHSPKSPSRLLLYRRRHLRSPSSASAAAAAPASASASAASAAAVPGSGPSGRSNRLPLPLPTLLLLHRHLVANEPLGSPSLAQPVPPTVPPGSAASLCAAAEASPAFLEGESIAFINFLVAEIVASYRNDPAFMNWLKVDVLQAAINRALPGFVDRATISDFSLGQIDQFLLFRKARLRPCRHDPHERRARHGPGSHSERWRIELDVEFENLTQVAERAASAAQAAAATAATAATTSRSSGSLRQRKISSSHSTRAEPSRPAAPQPSAAPVSPPPPPTSTLPLPPPPPPESEQDFTDPGPAFLELGIDTQLVLNWPRKEMAALPVHLVVEVTQFRGTVAIEFHPSPSSDDDHTHHRSPSPTAPPPAKVAPIPSALTFSLVPGYTLDVRVSSLLGSRTKLRDVPKIADLITIAIQSRVAAALAEPSFVAVPLPGIPKPKSEPDPQEETVVAGLSPTEQEQQKQKQKQKQQQQQQQQQRDQGGGNGSADAGYHDDDTASDATGASPGPSVAMRAATPETPTRPAMPLGYSSNGHSLSSSGAPRRGSTATVLASGFSSRLPTGPVPHTRAHGAGPLTPQQSSASLASHQQPASGPATTYILPDTRDTDRDLLRAGPMSSPFARASAAAAATAPFTPPHHRGWTTPVPSPRFARSSSTPPSESAVADNNGEVWSGNQDPPVPSRQQASRGREWDGW